MTKRVITFIVIFGINLYVYSQKHDEVFKEHIIPLNDSISINQPEVLISEAFLTDIAKYNIVAMGEATHGVREFQSFRFAIFKELAEKYNFRVFMIESPMMWALAINNYVQNGNLTIEEALKGKNNMYNVFSLYMSEDFVAFVKWMRDFNLTHKDKIIFHGIDNQMSFLYADTLIRHANQIDSSFCNNSFPILKKCSQSMYGGYDCIDSIMEKKLVKELDTLQYLFSTVHSLSSKQKNILLHYISVARQDFEYAYSTRDGERRSNIRDSSMFENVKWNIETYANKSEKVFIIAHNLHISMRSGTKYKRLGVFLNNYYGKEYFPIGMECNKGQYSTQIYKNNNIISCSKKINKLGYFKHISRKLKHYGQCYYFNIRVLVDNGIWVDERYTYTQYFTREKLTNLYKGFIFINEIHPSNFYEYKYKEENN